MSQMRAVRSALVAAAAAHTRPPLLCAPPPPQDYSLRKHVERWWKASVHGSDVVSVAEPGRYARRFWHAMQAVLLSEAHGDGSGGTNGTLDSLAAAAAAEEC